ncbi:MAG: hypothetical protein TQ37_03625 [Candidatus Synechococcus spongiarum 15L]|uniref:Uncharacterized protein n=1 Tax=Candidatus Synechococcus spongiarum 15L TaxID=1608419 RepID=A0A0G8AXH7_9SYNE|nr:MAG: hypothetical protein TQ37_03625 [Candidatus Synechococcus spongiarum 15L]MCY4359864.1 hypothetical protein [Cyanobacteria bacterium MAG APA_bin_95]
MLKRLEQISAIVVALGLAMVSYWLFFSWAGGGGAQNRQRPRPQAIHPSPLRDTVHLTMGEHTPDVETRQRPGN